MYYIKKKKKRKRVKEKENKATSSKSDKIHVSVTCKWQFTAPNHHILGNLWCHIFMSSANEISNSAASSPQPDLYTFPGLTALYHTGTVLLQRLIRQKRDKCANEAVIACIIN